MLRRNILSSLLLGCPTISPSRNPLIGDAALRVTVGAASDVAMLGDVVVLEIARPEGIGLSFWCLSSDRNRAAFVIHEKKKDSASRIVIMEHKCVIICMREDGGGWTPIRLPPPLGYNIEDVAAVSSTKLSVIANVSLFEERGLPYRRWMRVNWENKERPVATMTAVEFK